MLHYLEDGRDEAIKMAVDCLNNNQVIIFPTDTIYGLMARADSESGYQQIMEMKKRPENKPLALLLNKNHPLFSNCLELLNDHEAERIMFSEGKLTLIFDPLDIPDSELLTRIQAIQPGTVGIRCPRYHALNDVISETGGALWATSVNLSSEPAAIDAGDVERFLQSCDNPIPIAFVSKNPTSGTASQTVILKDGELTHISR